MKILRIIGIFLILIGIAMIATGDFSFKQKKKVLGTDVVNITTKETKRVTWPWFAGIAVIAGAVILLVAGEEKGRTSRKSAVHF